MKIFRSVFIQNFSKMHMRNWSLAKYEEKWSVDDYALVSTPLEVVCRGLNVSGLQTHQREF